MFCGQLQVPYESSMYKLPLLSISNFFKKLKNLCQFVKNYILKFAFNCIINEVSDIFLYINHFYSFICE